MNLTRSGYLGARSVKEGKRRVRFSRYSRNPEQRRRVVLPLGTLPRRGFAKQFFEKRGSCTCFN